MWDTPVPIFEDEDEDKLIGEFVRLSALYPQYEPFQITAEVFKGLKDPTMRANQAAMIWSKDLSILERIRQARLAGPADQTIQNKEQLEARIKATIEDTTLHSQEKKVRIEGYMNFAKLKGWVDSDSGDEKRRVPVVMNFGIDPRSQTPPVANAA
jgi:hypothetical protein